MIVIDLKPSYLDEYWSRFAFLDLGYLDGVWSEYYFGVNCVILFLRWFEMLLVPSRYVVNYIAI